ncbi:unnamed protein product [Trifolium pratense]|uniref:Uncharacterized protein n=1 Tax=Trifolium pratense TaxID=57577 RepID=A0ACB0LQD6_TRIPR|nr:unnamed protein product [Trifolium pratense]
MAANQSDDQVSLAVFVDKEKSKVVYAEAGKDFVDVLLSFLTLPLGTIARLVAKESNIEAVQFGSISSLYQSISDLGEEYLWNKTCKEMLLQPRNSMEAYCQKMKLNIDETESLSFFFCEDDNCKRENGCNVSTFRDQKGICGKLLNIMRQPKTSDENGFVNETSTFIISYDLFVMPNLFETRLNLLQKLGVTDFDTIDKKTVNISKKEVIDLLKLSLISKTPLTDFIFKKEKFILNFDTPNLSEFLIGEAEDSSINMVVKVVRRKSNIQILFVEAQEDFADFVFSFLTFPLGGVLHMLKGHSSISCIENLYKSMTELCPDRYLRSQYVKDRLSSPCIGLQFEIRNQILPIGAEPFSHLFNFVDPKSPIYGGYARGPTSFMVTDDLVVSPMSSISGLAYLERMKVPLNDVEECFIRIGRMECLSILKASLISTSALTNGLSLCILHQMFREYYNIT